MLVDIWDVNGDCMIECSASGLARSDIFIEH